MSFGSKLSPKLRKVALKASSDALVRCLVELAPGADEAALERALTSLGAQTRSRSTEARLLTIDIPANRLSALDDIQGIVYVEAGERYRH
jgi:hypothetical protein